MLPDAATLREVKGWLGRADSDLRTAAVARAAEPALLDAVVFHAQQAAEKASKAFLVLHGRSFRKTHSIEEIGEAALVIDGSLVDVVEDAAPLTEYAWKFRYPGEQSEPPPDEADEALAIARRTFDAIVGRVPVATRP